MFEVGSFGCRMAQGGCLRYEVFAVGRRRADAWSRKFWLSDGVGQMPEV
ncbi:hypothetical protein ACKX2L_09015 [Lachnospiraceae bacterium YH-ros2228]